MSESKLNEYNKDELQKMLNESASYADFFGKIGMYKHGSSYKTLRNIIEKYNLDTTIIEQNGKQNNLDQIRNLGPKDKIVLDDVFSGKRTLGTTKLKDRLIKEGYKKHICKNCKLTEWLGNPIPLQLHHIDGNRDNNSLENLKLLCPNCHSLTDNFCGKNIKQKKNEKGISGENKGKKDICPICNKNFKTKQAKMCSECYKKQRESSRCIDREKLKEEIRLYSFSQVGKMYGVTDRAIRKWCKKLGLPIHSREIKKMTNEEWSEI